MRHRVLASALILSVCAGCHSHGAPEPLLVERAYCWWTTRYVSVAPAWVAGRFQTALQELGFVAVKTQLGGDSVWVTTAPSAISGGPEDVRYSFRAVAFPVTNSIACSWRGMPSAPIAPRPAGAQSCYHTDVLIYAMTRAHSAADSAAAGDRIIPLCGDVFKSALAGLDQLE
jgi:hypothetical protein